MKYFKKISIGLSLIFSIYVIQGCGPSAYVSTDVHYTNPVWAPAYYPGVRYYYLPDIETYYDLSDQEFVYLNGGQWLFSPMLPSIYSNYDLYNGFAVALNVRVYHPWLHHEYYISHYPRYYYHNVYHDNVAAIRGFNENVRKPFYTKPEDRSRVNAMKTNLKVERAENVGKVEKVQPPKPPQKTNYYGKKVGQPVRVRSWMKESKPKKNEHSTSKN